MRSALTACRLLGIAWFGAACLSLDGCRSSTSPPRLLAFADGTGSAVPLRHNLIRYTTEVGLAAPPGTVIEVCRFSSDVPLAPFFTGQVRHPAAFHNAVTVELSKPPHGRGTFGAPLLRRIRERIKEWQQPTFAAIIGDGGFDDLPAIRTEAGQLATQPAFLGLYVLPVTSESSAYTRLEAALSPLGRRVRLAASADATEAIREAQIVMRSATRPQGGN